MAANYWDSTQYRFWQFTKESLAAERQRLEEKNADLVQMFPLPEQRHLCIFFHNQVTRLAKRLGVRLQAIATAQVFMKRFYTRVEIRRTNPYLVIVTALYLACKAEECPQHIRLVLNESRNLWPDLVTLDTHHVGECEFFMISEMNSQLIVHQPYRSLLALQSDLALTQEDMILAWNIINDHYMTDLPLLYPPHIIAITAISLTLAPAAMGGNGGEGASNNGGGGGNAIGSPNPSRGMHGTPVQAQPSQTARAILEQTEKLKERERAQQEVASARAESFSEWLADSDVDLDSVVDCTQEMISFYECQEQHNNKHTQEQINRLIKTRGLDK